MDSNFKNIKDQMGAEDNKPLPPSLEWAQMETGIMEKMEVIESTEKPVPFWRRRLSIGLGILLLFVPIYCTQKTKLSTRFSVAASSLAQIESQDKIQAKSTPISTDQLQDYVVLKSEVSELIPTSSILIKEAKTSLNAKSTIDPKELMPKEKVAQEVVKASKESPRIPSIEFMVEYLPQLQGSIIIKKTVGEDLIKATSAKAKGSLTLLSGVNIWNPGFGKTSPQHANFEKAIPSFQFSMNYQHYLKQDYFLLFGIQYQRLESRFDWSGQIENYSIVLQDTILQIQINSFTGQESITRGDVELEVDAIRNVHHYNQYELYQLPIAFGKKITFDKWTLDIMAGGLMNIFYRNEGRSLNRNQIIALEDAGQQIANGSWNIHGLVGSRLNYQFNEDWAFTTGLQLQKSFTNWSLVQKIQLRPTVLNLDLGFTLSL